ncbi:MAG TPA: OmpH family outer membrane protein [Blastocatellia bacterium]|nr:OmpH family outer membrane protein [Blastocatellia bacterium]
MKRFILFAAVCSLFSLSIFAQTPTPRPTTPAANNAAAAAPSGGMGAEGKVALINTSRFANEIAELKVRRDKLQSEFEPKNKELEDMANKINGLKNQVQTQGTTVSQQVRDQWVEQGAELEKSYKRKAEDYDTLAKKRADEELSPVYQKLNTFLQQYAQQRGFAMVIDGVAAQQSGLLLYAIQTSDITDDFVKEYNRANPAAAGAAPAKK